MMPGDPVVGGNVLRRPAIASPDYVPGVSGWSINASGSAQFNNLSIIIQPGSASGFVLTVTDVNGNVLANIDTLGNITGQTVNAVTDVIVAGNSQLAENTALAAAIAAIQAAAPGYALASDLATFEASTNASLTAINTAITALGQPVTPPTPPPVPPPPPPVVYTELFYGSTTWSFNSRNGGTLLGQDISLAQGALSGTYYDYSYIEWAAGSLGNNLNTVLNRTVSKVTLRLKCLTSHNSAGMQFGLHSSTSLGGPSGTYSNVLNGSGGTLIGSGALVTYTLSPAEWAPFAAGGVTYLVISPTAGNLENPAWSGTLYGGGGSNAYMPLLTVTYT